jgi:hypothetical protein
MDAYMNAKDFIFEPVSTADEHILALYQLLENRKNTISHSGMPTYPTHDKHRIVYRKLLYNNTKHDRYQRF